MNNHQKPFGSIAIGLSGGGYRATAFHLGTLDFLEYVGILQDVTMISTVSGGTFTGARYALSQADGKSFPEFFQGFYQDLASTHLPSLWLEELNAQRESGTDEIKLIKAAANVYNQRLFNGAKFGQLFDAAPNIHLKEIIFNATEFDNGLVFRFQRSNGGLIGNSKIAIPPEVAKQIRIADIVASSSCFPGGFEPMVFPDDYFSETEYDKIKEKLPEKLKSALPVALMDGGVDDNQGVQSLMLANDRIRDRIRKGKPTETTEIGLLIVSDTDNIQPSTEDIFQPSSYVNPASQAKTNQRILSNVTLEKLVLMSRFARGFIYLIPFLLLAQAISDLVNQKFEPMELLLVGLPFLLSLSVAGFLGLLFQEFRGNLLPNVKENLQKELGVSLWDNTRTLTVDEVLKLVEIRVSSMLVLPTVFMKRIRSLVSREVYSKDKDGNFNTYGNIVIANYIYDLEKKQGKTFTDPNLKNPSEKMQQIATASTNMETNLWFKLGEEKQGLNQVISCGQVTMCFNLLEYILKQKADKIGQDPVVTEVWNKSKAAWELMQNDPEALIKRYQV
jgi:predicted acylesterase/phospholipase RssA